MSCAQALPRPKRKIPETQRKKGVRDGRQPAGGSGAWTLYKKKSIEKVWRGEKAYSTPGITKIGGGKLLADNEIR